MRKKIPLYQSLKFKINILVTIIFLVMIVFLISKSNQNQQEMIKMHEDSLNQIAIETIDRRFKVSFQILETSLSQITVSPLISNVMASGDVEKLYKLVSQSYDKLKNVGVDEFYFFLADGNMLLNLSDNDVNQFTTPCDRDIIKDINSDPNHLPIKGMEQCQHGLFIRYIAPIYNNNKYIGSVELGMEVGSRILNIFKNVSGGEWYLYSFNNKEQNLIEGTIEDDTYLVDINDEIAASLAKGEVVKIDQSPYIIQMIPILNYKGEYANYFKRIFDNSDLIAIQNEYTKQYIISGVSAAIIVILLLWSLMTYLLSPLIYLEQKARKFKLGTLDESIEVRSNDEIGYLAEAMENMRQSLYKRESELKEQSYIDPLTGVYNRLYLEHHLDEIVVKDSFPTTIIMADIDGLKEINDKEGHAAGDAYIVNCAETIKGALRANDNLFRIGGDEFILLFANTDKQTGELILKRIKREFEIYNKNLKKDQTILSVSFGMSVCEGTSDCLENTIASADKNMYEEKAKKKKLIE